jgi:hypothetical protein
MTDATTETATMTERPRKAPAFMGMLVVYSAAIATSVSAGTTGRTLRWGNGTQGPMTDWSDQAIETNELDEPWTNAQAADATRGFLERLPSDVEDIDLGEE